MGTEVVHMANLNIDIVEPPEAHERLAEPGSLRRHEPPTRYGAVAKMFHWVIATLLLVVFALAISFSQFDPGDLLYWSFAYWMHMSLGMVFLGLSAAAALWRLTHQYPPPPPEMNGFLRATAKTAHLLLYFFILVVPFTGWLLLSVRKSPAVLLGTFHWPNIGFLAGMTYSERVQYNDLILTPHIFLAYAGMCLVGLHLAAALYHHFYRHDNVLRRMLPGRQLR
jgi:cytochrome b561